MMSSDNGTPPIGAIIYGACIVLGCLFLLTMITLRACLYCARRDQQRWEEQETKMQQAIRLQAPAAPPKFSMTLTESNTSMNSINTEECRRRELIPRLRNRQFTVSRDRRR